MPSSATKVGTYFYSLVLAVSVPLLVFTAGVLWRTLDADRHYQQAELRAIATHAADRVDLQTEELRAGLLGLATSGALATEPTRHLEPAITALAQRSGASISVVGADGQAIAQAPAGIPDPSGGTPELSAAVQHAIHDRQPVLTNLLPAKGGRATVALVVPAPTTGSADPGFALIARLDRDRLLRFAQLPSLGPAGLVIAVFDRSAAVVSRSAHLDATIGAPARSELKQAMSRTDAGLVTARTSPDGEPALVAFARAPVSGYTAAAIVPGEAAARRHALLLPLAVGLAMLALAIVAAGRLAARFAQALRAVDRRGDPASASGLREVDELTARLAETAADRDATETSLRLSEARLRELVGALDLAAIMSRATNGTIRFWSLGCTRMYGWTAEEAIGQSVHVLLRTRFPRTTAEIDGELHERGSWTGDLLHTCRDGSEIVVAVYMVLNRGADGTAELVTENQVDVTALRKAEDTLRAMNQDLEQRVQKEIAAREAVQQRAVHADHVQALGQLAGGIAHDFNNILQAIAGSAALIARHPRDADMVGRFVATISDAAARGAAITKRILLLARRGDLRAEPIDATELLDGLRDVFGYTLGTSIKIAVTIAPDLSPVMADKAQLETALVNLATNARDAMPDGGTLHMTATAETVGSGEKSLSPGRYVCLTVADTGTGMDGATLARIGEPFFSTKGIGKGTGLGLSVVRGFAEQSGGAFSVESRLGSGTTARVWLPAAALGPDRSVPAPADLVDGHAQILVVDDDPLVRDTVTEQLEDLGHQVLAASGGTDALAILRARKAVDLMITDLSMPGMNGLALIQQARQVQPNLPAILLTGYANNAVELSRTDAGPSYTLIRKPASLAVLKARIGELLSHA